MATLPLISIVDDDDPVRESLRGLLRSVGFRVAMFASAEAFLQSDHLHDTDCLILDFRMPGMNGLELQHHLVASESDIPVVFITAHGLDDDLRSRALQDGAVDYLIKPFSEDALLEAVNAALRVN
jgi:FixJ family two-component response regulator